MRWACARAAAVCVWGEACASRGGLRLFVRDKPRGALHHPFAKTHVHAVGEILTDGEEDLLRIADREKKPVLDVRPGLDAEGRKARQVREPLRRLAFSGDRPAPYA